MNKNLLLFIALCFSSGMLSAQTLSQSVLASTGAYATAGSYTFSYTVGEMAAVETFTGGGYILTQGFQQPNDILLGLLEVDKEANGSMAVYPVPAMAELWFGYEFDAPGRVEVTLYDMTGRRLDYTMSEAYGGGKATHRFDCTPYAAGHYLLTARYSSSTGAEKTMTKKIEILN